MPHVLLSTGPDDTGLAIARALRSGLPDLHLTAISRAPHGPAVHSDVFDAVWRVRSWETLNPEAHADAIAARLDSNGWLLPASPAETHWLADALGSHERVLVPPSDALIRTSLPAPEAAQDLPLSAPATIPLTAPVEDLHAFGRLNDWMLWMRAPVGIREPIEHWNEFDRVRDAVARQADDPNTLYLQRRVKGDSLTLSFAAHEGRLLDATLVRPRRARDTFHVESIPNELRAPLDDTLDALGWTGGGALDLIEDDEGSLWLDAWRPCFGTMVEGAAQCGRNLPAQLVAACTERSVASTSQSPAAFTRTPTCVPVEATAEETAPEAVPDSPPVPFSTQPTPASNDAELTDALRVTIEDLPTHWDTCDTPRSVLLPTRTRERFSAFVEAAARIETAFDIATARVGLSIKTNPAERLIEVARETGMLAETIHPEEMEHASRHGYTTDEIVINGPVQALLPTLDSPPFALFGDAVKDLCDLPFDPTGSIIGVRTRPPERGPSRFGVDLSHPDRMNRLCDHLAVLPSTTQIGLHLHAPSSTLGHSRWWEAVGRVLDWAQTIEERTGRAVECLDLGGGWHPDDWLDVFVPGLLERRDQIQEALPALRTLLLEPGKALSQPLGTVVSRVLDARPSRNEIILDASLAELSNIEYHPHRLLAHTNDRGWHRLPRGDGRLLGRLCMEADILGHNRRVDHLSPGDTIVICDAGAYDASMTYPFGRGHSAATD